MTSLTFAGKDCEVHEQPPSLPSSAAGTGPRKAFPHQKGDGDPPALQFCSFSSENVVR